DDRALLGDRGPADPLANGNPQVQGRARPGPRGEGEFRSVHIVDPDPRVVRNLPQLSTHEVRDRLALASGMDDFLEAGSDLVVADLAFLARHDFAELPDSLHRARLSVERPRPP